MLDTQFKEDIVIGLEIHVGLNTNSKLFCSCSNKKSKEPNTNICPICLGHPGSKPTLNKSALEYSIKLAKALNFSIANRLVFSRKVYFYPDLVKNFQITQYEEPIGKDGFIIVQNDKIELERIHIEEDPGALIHKKNSVLIDYNRSGSPLCEIVTKPQIKSAKQAREFIKKLLVILDYLDIFDYENGVVKADLNISIKETNYKRVEIKGVSGLKDIENALDYEILRQKQNILEIVQETRGYDSENKITFSQRTKEDAKDYGYIYEPDLKIRNLENNYLDSIYFQIPKLVDDRINDYIKLGLKEDDAVVLSSIKSVSDIFEESLKQNVDLNTSYKFFKREIISKINEGILKPSKLKNNFFQEQIINLVKLYSERKINNHSLRNILDKLVVEDFIVLDFVKNNNLIIQNTINLSDVCKKIINNFPQAVTDYKSGTQNSLNYLVGQVLKEMKGAVMPDEVKLKIKEIINKE